MIEGARKTSAVGVSLMRVWLSGASSVGSSMLVSMFLEVEVCCWDVVVVVRKCEDVLGALYASQVLVDAIVPRTLRACSLPITLTNPTNPRF